MYQIEIMGPQATTINFTVPADSAEAARAAVRNMGHEPLRVLPAWDVMPIGAWARDWADTHGLAGVA